MKDESGREIDGDINKVEIKTKWRSKNSIVLVGAAENEVVFAERKIREKRNLCSNK